MIEYILKNSISGVICMVFILCLLWYPDFAGYNETRLSLWIPCTGAYYIGSQFDSDWYKVLTIGMAAINGFALLGLSIRHLSLGRANRVLPFFYLFVIFSYPQTHAFSFAHPAALCVLLGLYAIFRSGEEKSPMAPLFISSFLCGCACLLFLPSLPALVSFVAIAFVLNLLNGRNLLVLLGGGFTILGGCLFCRYLFYNDLSVFLYIISDGFKQLYFQIAPPTPATLFLTLVFLYLLGKALLRWLHCAYGNQSYKYKVLASFMWMFVICGLPLFIYVDKAYSYLPILAIPASVLLSFYFSEQRITKRMKIEFIVLLLAATLNQIAYLL